MSRLKALLHVASPSACNVQRSESAMQRHDATPRATTAQLERQQGATDRATHKATTTAKGSCTGGLQTDTQCNPCNPLSDAELQKLLALAHSWGMDVQEIAVMLRQCTSGAALADVDHSRLTPEDARAFWLLKAEKVCGH
jgi:hypothetical protein